MYARAHECTCAYLYMCVRLINIFLHTTSAGLADPCPTGCNESTKVAISPPLAVPAPEEGKVFESDTGILQILFVTNSFWVKVSVCLLQQLLLSLVAGLHVWKSHHFFCNQPVHRNASVGEPLLVHHLADSFDRLPESVGMTKGLQGNYVCDFAAEYPFI